MSLSARGHKALSRPPLLKCALFENQFDPHTTPHGLINLGVADNSLVTDWLMDYYRDAFTRSMTARDFTYGNALGGSERLFRALKVLCRDYFGSLRDVERDHVIAGSGCGSVIDLLASCIADAGDGILVARPFYNGFAASFECRSGVIPIGVDLDVPVGEEGGIEAILSFERKLRECRDKGIVVRAIMLCNPHNPLGFCYPKETLLAYARFAQKFDLHLISDEIYALSVFKTDDPPLQEFVSILSIDPMLEAGCDPARIHCIYGASKDFGSNGLRLGCLISQSNPPLHKAMESSILLIKVSSPADVLWSSLLLDPIQLTIYINLNRQLLSDAYRRAVRWLEGQAGQGIKWRKSNAGHFIWIDLRGFLAPEGGVKAEEELAERFWNSGVNVARGTAYSNSTPGFFRLTFCVRQDVFELGLQRIERVLGLPSLAIPMLLTPPLEACGEGFELGVGFGEMSV